MFELTSAAAIDWMAWVEHRMARGGFPV